MRKVMKMEFEAEKDAKLVLEPWGHVEKVMKGQKVDIAYRDLNDGTNGNHWPGVALLENGDVMITIASIDIRASKNGELFYDCWD